VDKIGFAYLYSTTVQLFVHFCGFMLFLNALDDSFHTGRCIMIYIVQKYFPKEDEKKVDEVKY